MARRANPFQGLSQNYTLSTMEWTTLINRKGIADVEVKEQWQQEQQEHQESILPASMHNLLRQGEMHPPANKSKPYL
jgi:hypothetical protein